MKTLILLCLIFGMCSSVWAQVTKIGNGYKDNKGKIYSITEVPLVSDYSYQKPDIDSAKILTKDEQDVVEYSLKENGRRLVHIRLRHIKNDYEHDFARGTVEYTPRSRNYSYHSVVIPDGTIIVEANFTQKEPNTEAITGKNLTFIGCNLVNNKIDPTWILETTNITQKKNIKKSEKNYENCLDCGIKEITISVFNKDKQGNWMEVEDDVETTMDTDEYNLLMLRLNTE